MSLAQNKRNIRWGLYLMFAAVSWGLMQIELLDAMSSNAYKWFTLISLSVLVFFSFFLLVVFGFMPRFTKFLVKTEILTIDQTKALKMLPTLDKEE